MSLTVKMEKRMEIKYININNTFSACHLRGYSILLEVFTKRLNSVTGTFFITFEHRFTLLV